MENSLKKTASCVQSDVAKIIEDAIFWFEDRIETLNDLASSKEGIVIAIKGADDIKLSDEESRAFKAGITIAINIIGKFPLSLDGTVESIDLDDLDD